MARVYKRKNYQGPNKWWLDYNDCDGIRHREPGAPNKESAELLLAAELVAAGEGRRLNKKEAAPLAFEKIANEYQETYGKIYKDTWTDDRSRLRYINAAKIAGVPFGRLLITKIKPKDVAACISVLKDEQIKGKQKTNATLNRYRTTMEAIFTWAMDNKYVSENPVKGVPKFTEKKPKTRFADTSLWLDLQRKASDWMRPMVQLAGWTGMRKGEVFGIQLEHLKLDLGLIEAADNKEDDAEKFVSLPDVAVAMLRDQLKRPRPADCPYLFYSTGTVRDDAGQLRAGPEYRADGPWHRLNPTSGNSRFATEWDTLRAACGQPDFKFHWLRHTCASHMALGGAQIQDIAAQLNHSRTSTSERYMHLTPAHMVRAVNRVATALPDGTHLAQKGLSIVEPDASIDETSRQVEAK
jgi:integrase